MQEKQIQSATRSILRYPGSKARLAGFIAKTILLNGFHRPIFVEPFCGGASISIALLESNIVREVVINDIDPMVSSLWECVFSINDAKWLAESIMQVPLTLKYWQHQKSLNPTNLRELALKCLYLNRTSFSGILHSSAGPIGGRAQEKWDIGCRFNRKKLSARILELSHLSNRVRTITQNSWRDICEKWRDKEDVFFYLDPPFYNKANRLYRFVFNDAEHQSLCNYLKTLECPWVLSYDNAKEIRGLYDDKKLRARIIDNTYSAHPIGGNSFIGREVVYSNLKGLPLPGDNKSDHVGLSVKKFKAASASTDFFIRIPMVVV